MRSSTRSQPNTQSVRQTLANGAAQLRAAKLPYPDLDAELLCGFALKKDRVWLATHSDLLCSAPILRRYRVLLRSRARHTPLAYLTGKQSFYGRDFVVRPGVLVPRADSELLIARGLHLIPHAPCRIADIGTGSGCLGLTLLAERPMCRLDAVDRSPIALGVAQRNAKSLRLSNRVRWHRGNLLLPLRRVELDLIVANPPYLTSRETWSEPSIRREPKLALDGGSDGLRLYRELFVQYRQQHRHCPILLEIDPRRKNALGNLATSLLPSMRQHWHRDLAGRWRVLELRYPSSASLSSK